MNTLSELAYPPNLLYKRDNMFHKFVPSQASMPNLLIKKTETNEI